MSFHLPKDVAAEVIYRKDGSQSVVRIPASRDPFDVLDHVQRKLFPVLSDEAWERFQAIKAKEAEK